jgi:UDP-glucose 4-epimerase
MKYLVTGGAGFIGSHIVQDLLEQNHEVVVLDNFFTGKHENLSINDNLRRVHGSITDIKVLKEVCESVDGVFHEAAIISIPYSIKEPVITSNVNIHGTHNVLVAARDQGVKKVIFASSCAVYGNQISDSHDETLSPIPKTPYALSKYNGEKFLQSFSHLYGIKTVSLRYFNVYGPRQDPSSEYSAVIPKFITSILKHRPPTIYGDGMQTRDFVYVKDISGANLLAMKKASSGVYNIGSGVGTTINDLLGIISGITEIPIRPNFKPARRGDIFHSVANISYAKNTFGYIPEYSLTKGLKETIEWFRGIK